MKGLVLAVLATASVVLTVIGIVQARERFARDCAPHIHSVPPEKWHGGVPPKVRMPKGCS